jgi:hypothetical protein
MVPASPKDAVKNYACSPDALLRGQPLGISGDLNQRQQMLAQNRQFL